MVRRAQNADEVTVQYVGELIRESAVRRLGKPLLWTYLGLLVFGEVFVAGWASLVRFGAATCGPAEVKSVPGWVRVAGDVVLVVAGLLVGWVGARAWERDKRDRVMAEFEELLRRERARRDGGSIH